MNIKEAFNRTTTQNGDLAFYSTNNQYMDILFNVESFRNNELIPFLDIKDMEFARKFAMLIRDARIGLGERDLGRKLFLITKEKPENILEVGRADDVFWLGIETYKKGEKNVYFDFLMEELKKENELVKKWMPRKKVHKNNEGKNVYKNVNEVNTFLEYFNLTDREYRKIVKVITTETLLTNSEIDKLEYSKIPSLALLKYMNLFARKDKERFEQYLNDVKDGKEKINTAVATVYDVFKKYENDNDIESASILFENLPELKIGKIIPIIDNSGSMYDDYKSYLKARSIGYYVARHSEYMKNHFIVFSSQPRLKELKGNFKEDIAILKSFNDVSNTDFGAVMEKLSEVTEDLPDYLLVLSDMQFDAGSAQEKDKAMELLKKNNKQIKIIWWNFCINNATMPETDEYGNIFLSGYNPRILELFNIGFNLENYVTTLVNAYWEKIKSKIEF